MVFGPLEMGHQLEILLIRLDNQIPLEELSWERAPPCQGNMENTHCKPVQVHPTLYWIGLKILTHV